MARLFLLLLMMCVGLSDITAASPCKSVPGDPGWPDSRAWAALNASVDGSLIKNEPIAAVCYQGQSDWPYNGDACAFVTSNWHNASLQLDSPIGYQYPRDLPCPPPLDGVNVADEQCSLGDSPIYTINATKHSHVTLGIRFARERNIRLVIRNSGHDLLARSNGFGSLQIWMRYLRTGIDYANAFEPSTPETCDAIAASDWNGPSIRIGGGYDWGEVYSMVSDLNIIVVGGSTPTVGCMGWLQGGGHSLVSHDYGLGADQLLEAEVILANSSLVTVNACSHPDLFRSIRGGGPAYGVVVSGTWKAYPTQNVTSYSMTFSAETLNDTEAFYSVLEAVYEQSVHILDSGLTGYGVWSVSGQLTGSSSGMPAYTHYLMGLRTSQEEVQKILAPLTTRIKSTKGLTFESGLSEYPSYAAAQAGSFTFSAQPAGNLIAFGSRLLDKKALTGDPSALRATIKTLAGDANQGTVNSLLFVGGGKVLEDDKGTAVLRAWRSTYVHALVQRMWDPTTPREEVDSIQQDITNVKVAALKKLAPDTGAYMNEADRFDPEWQADFYGGDNYARLQKVKDVYDPEGIFYCPTCVGAPRWEINEAGALCPT
ncbi:FAD/FMN-containing protein [Xylaria intraflava]|nr:FAD/FMN-containing protein [Xylaria intraflava]